jgi:hypothetical protein
MEMGLLEVLRQYAETVKERHARRAMPTSIVRDFGSRSETPVFFLHLGIKVPLLRKCVFSVMAFPFLFIELSRISMRVSFSCSCYTPTTPGMGMDLTLIFCSCNKQQDWLLLIFLQAPR